MKKFFIYAGLIIFFSFLLAYLLGYSFRIDDDSIYIAVAGPMTGIGQNNGSAMIKGINLCLHKINKSGGINGKYLTINIFDDENNSEKALNIASDIITDNRALLVLGHYFSSSSHSAGKIYNEIKIPAITASATANIVTSENEWYFRTVPNNAYMGKFIAHYINKVLKYDSASIIYDIDTYGSDLANNFEKSALKLQMKIKLKRGFDSKALNLKDKLKSIYQELRSIDCPGMIFIATHGTEGVKIVTALKYPGSKYKIFGPDSFGSKSFINKIKNTPMEKAIPGYYSDDIYAISPFIIDIANEKAQKFRSEFKAIYNEEPSWVSVCYYDAMLVAYQAMKEAQITGNLEYIETERQKIQNVLSRLYNPKKAVKGLTGDIFFDRQRNFNRPFAVGVYKKQRLISTPSQYQIVSRPRNLDNIMQEILDGNLILLDGKYMRKTRLVYTGIDINEISELDTINRSCAIDFYLWFRYQGDFEWQNIEFVNADNIIELNKKKQSLRITNDIIQSISEKKIGDYTIKAYRIRAVFQNDFDFHSYPFDTQTLRIQFRHSNMTRDQLIYISDVVGMSHFITTQTKDEHLNYCSIPGWKVDSETFYQDMIKNDSTLGDPELADEQNMIQYSQFKAEINIKRSVLGYLFKDIISIVIMLVIIYIIYFISPEQFELRLLVGMGVLMTTAFLHQDVSSRLQVGYILAIDYTFFTVYILSGFSIVLSKMAKTKIVKNKQNEAVAIDFLGKIGHPSIALLCFSLLIYFYVL